MSKGFAIGKSEGWNAGVYYVGSSNNGDYWGSEGYGGSSFNGSSEVKDLDADRVRINIGPYVLIVVISTDKQ